MKLNNRSGCDCSVVCSFTGYRPSKMSFLHNKECVEYKRLYTALRGEIISLSEKGVRFFQTGMARGIDLICGDIVFELKRTYDIYLTCVIPCLNQYAGWGREDVKTYERLLSSADNIVNITSEPYSDGCMFQRNRYLVDTAQYLLAVFDGQKGGTMYTVNYAKKQKRTIIIINPSDNSRTELIHGNNKGVFYV